MTALRAALGLVPLLMIAAGCNASDPIAPEAADRATVRIVGPSEITVGGSYTWTAVLRGGDAADEEFHWEVSWADSDEAAIVANGRSITLEADPIRGRIELKVTVTSRGRTAAAAYTVNACASELFVEDALIPECDA